MAQLSSPGVSVTVIDESFYTPAAPGTVPLIVVATEQDKQNASGTGTAAGTLAANAGQVYLLTSQKDLADTFGTPVFKTDANNNPIHAGEQNEYGLQAAYSYLGVSNRAYVVRADVDLGQLDALADAPAGAPEDGTFWIDVASTKYGIFEWNSAPVLSGGQKFVNKVPTVITETAKIDSENNGPLASIGAVGDYAVVALANLNTLWFKKPRTRTPAEWVEVGSAGWISSWPTAVGTAINPTLVGGNTLIINGITYTGHIGLDTLVEDINTSVEGETNEPIDGITAAVINGRLEIYSTGIDVEISGSNLSLLGLPAGTYKSPRLQISKHTQVPQWKRTVSSAYNDGRATGSVWVKTTAPNLGANWSVKKYSATTLAWVEQSAPLYANGQSALAGVDPTGGGLNLAVGATYIKYNDFEEYTNDVPPVPTAANFKIYARSTSGATRVTSKIIDETTFNNAGSAKTISFTMQESTLGNDTLSAAVTVTFPGTKTINDANLLAAAISGAGLTNVSATVNASNQIVISHKLGGEIYFVDTGTPGQAVVSLSSLFSVSDTNHFFNSPVTGTVRHYVASNWTPTVNSQIFAVASTSAPTTEPADNQLWYSSMVDEVDILVHNGSQWVGYQFPGYGIVGTAGYIAPSPYYTETESEKTDPAGPIISASKPTAQSDGTDLANGDLWIDTSDLENYPSLYKYNIDLQKWVLVDTSDQTTEDGIVFHDARWTTGPGEITKEVATPASITDLLRSDFVDFDAPDPALYPQGMLLWNLRRSGFNVKRFVRNYVDVLAKNHRYNDELMTNYYPHRWVSEAANQVNGSGTFGRKAQRRVVIQALQALVNSNQQIRDEESRIFNLLACPGYPELIGELVNLNTERGLTAFIVGDTPPRLTPDATSLSNWGNNVNGAVEDGDDGLVSFDEYLGVFYPWGYTSDNLGNNVVVPPSHMMLRTIALSDNVSYPWFAPAGTRRGGITNATSVGYITAEGEFASVALNNGQRDTLASIKVNPLTFITGTGLVNYGQYTRAKNASSLDRINVARLVVYLRRQFAQLAKPYVFEPNDKITRDEIKGAAENLLLELVGQRALYDYVVVCDTSNNTPSRIDRSELYLDVAIEPVKAVEFIYIPLRLKNTGEIKALGK